jgi:trehalose-6-phosphate synthase
MNLVSKEYVASQSDNPGVLVLSRFCGAADDLKEAMIVNPYDIDGTARALKRALEMPLGERKGRWFSLSERVGENSAMSWRNRFLGDLAAKEYRLFSETDKQVSRLRDSIVLPLNEITPARRKADNNQPGK